MKHKYIGSTPDNVSFNPKHGIKRWFSYIFKHIEKDFRQTSHEEALSFWFIIASVRRQTSQKPQRSLLHPHPGLIPRINPSPPPHPPATQTPPSLTLCRLLLVKGTREVAMQLCLIGMIGKLYDSFLGPFLWNILWLHFKTLTSMDILLILIY